MAKEVKLPDGTTLSFPDDATLDEITAAVNSPEVEKASVKPYEDAEAARPARMTLGLGGRSHLAQDITPPVAEEAPKGGLLSRRLEDAANAQAKKVGDVAAGRVGGSAAELRDEAERAQARDIAMRDPVRNVQATIEALPEGAKKTAGGLIQATAEGLGGRPLEGLMPEQLAGPDGLDRDRRDAFADIGASMVAAADAEEKKLKSGLKPSLLTEAVTTAIDSAAVMLPAMATGGLGAVGAGAGTAAARAAGARMLFGTMGLETFGQSYGQARMQGLEPGQAGAYAAIQAGIEVGTEFAPLRELFKKHPNVGQKFLNFMAVEVPQELLATTLQAAVDKASVNPNMTWADFEKQLALTVLSTPLAGGAQVGVARAAQGLIGQPAPEKDPAKALSRELQAAVDNTEWRDGTAEAAGVSLLNPDNAQLREVAAPVVAAESTEEAIAAAQAVVDGKDVPVPGPTAPDQGTPSTPAEASATLEPGSLELFSDREVSDAVQGNEQPGTQADVVRDVLRDGQAAINAGLSGYRGVTVTDGVAHLGSAPVRVVDPASLEPGEPAAGDRQRLTRDQASALAALGEATGRQVVFYADSPLLPDGLVDHRNRGVLFLSDNPQRAGSFVAGHELTHTLEGLTELASAVDALIAKGVTPEGIAYAERLHGENGGFGPSDPTERRAFLVKELKADLGGWALNDPTFLPKVVEEVRRTQGQTAAKGVLKQLIAKIGEVIGRIQKVFKKQDDLSAMVVSNLEEVRDGLAKLYAAQFATQAEKERTKIQEMQRSAKTATEAHQRAYAMETEADRAVIAASPIGWDALAMTPAARKRRIAGERRMAEQLLAVPGAVKAHAKARQALEALDKLEAAVSKADDLRTQAAEIHARARRPSDDIQASRKESGEHGRRVARDARSATVSELEASRVRKNGFRVTGNVVMGAPSFIHTWAAIKKQIDRAVVDARSQRSHPEDAVWYREAGRAIREYSHGDDVLAERLTRIVAKLSQAAGVDSNVTWVIKAAYQIAAGEIPSVGRFPNSFKKEFDTLMDSPVFDTSVKGVNRKLQNFYRNLHDEVFQKNDWPSAVVIDRHAIGYIWNNREKSTVGSDAQYDYAEMVIQKATEEYNRLEGTSLNPRDLQALLWGWWKRADEAEAARAEGREYKAEGTAWNYPEYFARGTANVTAETLPSTKTSRLDLVLSPEEKVAFSREAYRVILDASGTNELALRSGLILYTLAESTGGYEDKINPNVITGALALKAAKTDGTYHRYRYDAVDRYALGWQYIFRQDGVPWFRADPTIDPADLDRSRARREKARAAGKEVSEKSEPPRMSLGFAITFERALTAADEAAVFAALKADINSGVGYTKLAPDRIAVVNYRGEDHVPFLMSDAEFTAGVEKFRALEGVKAVGSFGAESEYHYHDFHEDPQGDRLLQGEALAAGGSDLQDWLRGRRAAFDALVRRWEEKAGRQEVSRSAKSGEDQDASQGAVVRGDARGTEEGREGATRDRREESLRADRDEALARVPQGFSRQVGPGTPLVSFRRGAHPIAVVGVHYGNVEGLSALDGTKFGSGAKSEEAARIPSWHPLNNRVYFYAQERDGRPPESERVVTAPYVYRAVLDNLYDFDADPDNLILPWRAFKATPEFIASRVDPWTALENAVLAVGYDGYLNRKAGALVVLGQKSVPAEFLGDRGEAWKHFEVQRSAKQRETPEFRAWAGDAEFVGREASFDRDFESGVPVVVETLHGTMGNFKAFSRERASAESDLGAGFYSTNNAEDVSRNYAGEGPDATNKIDRTVEREFGDENTEDEGMRAAAREDLGMVHGGMAMPLYVRFRKPAVLGGSGETYLSYDDRSLERFAQAVRKVAESYDTYKLEDTLAKLDEGPLRDAKVVVSGMDASDDKGDLVGSEIFRAALERMGFDGVIDQTVSSKFRTMDGMDQEGTKHFVAFKPNQLKSAIGNRGTFNRGADITRSAKAEPFTEKSLAAALATMEPRIAEQFEGRVRHAWQQLIAIPRYASNPYAAGSDFGNYQLLAAAKPFIKSERDASGQKTYALDDARLATGAAEYAREAAQEWHAKITEKVGALRDATLAYGHGADLAVDGTRDGKAVSVRQQMIVNVSPKGKLFNQFPALIYVDGKKTSEAAYKRAFADITRSAKPFYSELERAVAASKTSVAPPSAWRDFLKGRVSNGVVKQAEIDDSGVNEWLAVQPGKVTRDALADFVRAGGVRVETSFLTGQDLANRAIARGQNPAGAMNFGPDRHPDLWLPGGREHFEMLLTLPTETQPGNEGTVVFPHEHQVDEFLTAIADEGLENLSYGALTNAQGERLEVEFDGLTRAEVATFQDLATYHGGQVVYSGVKANQRAPLFRSTHYSSHPNLVAHVRAATYDTVDGKRYLGVNEVQSDWGQKGRDEGFATQGGDQISRAEYEAAIARGREVVSRYDNLGFDNSAQALTAVLGHEDWADRWEVDAPADAAALNEVRAVRQRYTAQPEKSLVAPAPFVTDTKAWTALAVRRVIAHAVENGFDGVFFTTGEQQAERYDLSKRVDKIVLQDGTAKGSTTAVEAYRNEERVISREVSTTELANVVGKELAERYLAERVTEGFGPHRKRTYAGLDLKIGGQGMRTYYDVIVPSVVNKILASYGAGKMGREAIVQAPKQLYPAKAGTPRAENRVENEQPAFPITDAMRAKVEELGVPQYSRKFDFRVGDEVVHKHTNARGRVDVVRPRPYTFDDVEFIDSKGERQFARDTDLRHAGTIQRSAKRPYADAPNSLMGFRRFGPQKGYEGSRYKKEITVRVSYPGNSWVDGMRGLNTPHAMERARRNWPDAEIELVAEKPYAEYERENPEVQRSAKPRFVKDEKGRDLKLYHGSMNDFTRFKTGRAGFIFLTTNDDYAASYAGPDRDPIEVRLVARKIADLDNDPVARKLAIDTFNEENFRNTDDGYSPVFNEKEDETWELLESPLARERFEEAGYDAIKFREWASDGDASGITYAVWDPAQVRGRSGGEDVTRSAKSAITNTQIGQTWQATALTEFDAVVRTLQDKLVDTKRVVQAIRAAGQSVADNVDPYLQETLFHGRAAKRVTAFAEDELRPLLQDMQARGVSQQELEDYLWAAHAAERNAQVARVNPNMPDGGSGLTNAQAAAVLQGLPLAVGLPGAMRDIKLDPNKMAAYAALQRRVDAITNRTLDTLVAYGLESKDTVDLWRRTYAHYVPLNRDLESDANFLGAFNLGSGTGAGFNVRGPASKRAMGSERAVVNVLANLAMQRERAIVRGEKNRVSQAVYGLATKAPNKDFWLPLNPDLRSITKANEYYAEWKSAEADYNARLAAGQSAADPFMTSLELKYLTARDNYQNLIPKARALQTKVEAELIGMGLNPADARSIAKEPQERYVEPNTGLVSWRLNPRLADQPHVLTLRMNGENRFVVFSNDERAKAMVAGLKNMTAEEMGWFLQNAAKVTRWFASVNTQYNPVFGLVNGLRDAQALVLNLGSTPIAGQQLKVLKYAREALAGIYSDLRAHRAGRPVASVWAQRFEDMGLAGGQTGYRDMFQNAAERADALSRELQRLSQGGWKWTKINESNPVFAWLSDYNTTIENAIRVATYQAALDAGMTKAQAANLAKNITVNFNKKGTAATNTGALYAFFNASVQGTARIAETLADAGADPSKVSGARLSSLGKKIILGGLVLGVMQALLGAAAGWDDDEPKQFQRERNLVLPVPGTDKYVSVPMPLGYHVLPNMGRIATEFVLAKGKDPGKRLTQLVSVIASAFNPIGGGDIVDALTPTIADPMIALARNKDWTGRQIAREDMNKFHPTPGWTRTKDTATPWAKWLAYGINYVTGGGQYGKGLASPSPDQIDYLIGQVTGGVGREVGRVAQTMKAPASGEELPLYKVPVLGRFVGETTGSAATASKFYGNLEKIGAHADPVTRMAKEHKSELLQDYFANHPEARLVQAANQMGEKMGELHREKQRLIKEGADKSRVRAIEERAKLAMQQFNALVARTVK